jgi:hypothetical protein
MTMARALLDDELTIATFCQVQSAVGAGHFARHAV